MTDAELIRWEENLDAEEGRLAERASRLAEYGRALDGVRDELDRQRATLESIRGVLLGMAARRG